MEAGYDYLLLRGQLQHHLFKYVGIIAFVFGAILLASGGAYYGYAAKARADLNELNVTLPAAVVETGKLQSSSTPPDSGPVGGDVPDGAVSGSGSNLDGGGDPAAQGSAKVLQGISAAAIGSRQLYPGESLTAGSWSNPWTYESLAYREQVLLQGFSPIEDGLVLAGGSPAAATRLIVPSIDIDSTVRELSIVNLGGSRAYETPSHTVGHIPESANPGESGSSWFFGHTESPILGEGSVFLGLMEIPDKLRIGEDVFIITDNGNQQFLYRATSSQVVHQDDMSLTDTGTATIHLVSCVPRLVYDHRLIITGELIAQKSSS